MNSAQHTATSATRSVVGIIGIGNMGMAMALNLRDKAYVVHVCDVDASRNALAQQAGCVVHASARDLAAHCDVVIIAVVNAAQTEAVLLHEEGVINATHNHGKPRCVMLCPTIAPEDVERFAAALAAQHIATIDAPMSGGPARARAGSMSLMVACDEALYAQHQPLLADLASRLFFISPRVGDGMRTKLVNNLLASINLAGAAQCLALAERMGLSLNTTLQVMEQSSAQSWIGSERMHRALSGDKAVLAHMSLLAKDSALAMQAAEKFKLPLEQLALGQYAANLFHAACEAGYAMKDDAMLLNYLQNKHALSN